MPYIVDRTVHDADAHIYEAPGWLEPWLEDDVRTHAAALLKRDQNIQDRLDKEREPYADPAFRERDEADITLRKGFSALGAFDKTERPAAIDYLGVASQLVFTTGGLRLLAAGERSSDIAMAHAIARGHNRSMLDFCGVDSRLLPVLYVPLLDMDKAVAAAQEALDLGAAALMIPSACPQHHSPSHIALEPLWAMTAEAGIPIVFHVGGTGDLIDASYFQNGLPIPPDFHGGEENFRSVDYMGIPGPPMQTLATMIFDGVLERFPELRIGVIEQGAIWLPSWMRQMESAFDAFARHEERLQKLSLRPSEYVQRQIRATPYPTEDVGWITEQIGPDICLFSTDYPHVEGGRRPVERFERSLGDANEQIRNRFYAENFIDLMGRGLSIP